jgi:pimeloyl-ACP methyl ester carboxylesterase
MSTRNTRWILAAGIAALVVGAILARAVEPGVSVEKLMLTANTPALRIFPATPGPHPIALLAHGNGGSKEMMFRFGEALAAAGFDCYSVDQAGYGESPQACSLTNLLRNFQELERALGEVHVFIGHSMGGGVGEWSVLEAGFRPRLFVGVGAPVKLGTDGPPLLLLGGFFEEFFRPAQLRARTDAQVVISPWSEHILEAYDPVLVRAAVKAACATVGKPVSAAPTAWRWRFLGLVLGIAAALVLMFRLPELHPRLARIRRFIVPAVLLLALVLTLGPWVGVKPQLRRIPAHLVVLGIVWLALAGLSRLSRHLVGTTSTSSPFSSPKVATTWKSSLPITIRVGKTSLIRCFLLLGRGSLAVVTGLLALGCLVVAFSAPKVLKTLGLAEPAIFLFATLTCALAISTLLLLPAVAVGRIASRGGSRRDGDIAMAIFASYVIGQFMPLFY